MAIFSDFGCTIVSKLRVIVTCYNNLDMPPVHCGQAQSVPIPETQTFFSNNLLIGQPLKEWGPYNTYCNIRVRAYDARSA